MGIRSRLFGTALSVVMLALSSGTALAVSTFNNGIVVGKQADFGTNINLQGNKLDFNRGASRIYDDTHLHIATDDFLYLDAPTATFVQRDLVVGKVLAINDNAGGRTTGSSIYDNMDLHIKTDDNLYLDAPVTTFVQNNLNVGGALTVAGSLILPAGSVTTTEILNGTILTVDLADSSVTSAKILDGTIANADISSGAAIADSKLATISTSGKVANAATTATSANTASTIVARDSSGNLSVGTVTGSLTGAASLNVLKAGDSMTGTLSVTPASGVALSASGVSGSAVLALTPNATSKGLTVGTTSGNAIEVNASMFTVVGSNGNTAIAGTLAVTGAVTGATFNKLTVTTPATGATLTVADGKTLTVNNTLALSGTDSTAFTLPAASDTLVGRSSTDTLTNKTLTSPSISGPVITGNISFGGATASHLISAQTTPPGVVASITGISAATCTGCTDTRGTITTTGTASATGTVTVTFNAAYASAPVVVITPANATGLAATPFISAVTTTTFTITAAGVAGATPSWNYMVMQ